MFIGLMSRRRHPQYLTNEYGNQYMTDQYGRAVRPGYQTGQDPYQQMGMYDKKGNEYYTNVRY